MTLYEIRASNKQAAVSGLAAVGFIALVVAGMWLAVYSTRFVPGVVNRAGSAAVYLGSIFTPAPTPGLTVVPTASTTISFGTDSGVATTTETKTPTGTTAPVGTGTTAGTKTTVTAPIGGSTASTTLSGLPDLIVIINDIGYLTTASTDSFKEAAIVPTGTRPAVSFTIKNVGTNVATPWRFSASIPTQTAYVYESQPQQALNPGDSIDYILGFDQVNTGTGQSISIIANFDHAVNETSTLNNGANASITVQ